MAGLRPGVDLAAFASSLVDRDWWWVLAGALAALLSAAELQRNRYPHTLSFLRGCRQFWMYCGLYFAAAAGLALLAGTPLMKQALFPKLPSWAQAIGIGLTLKGLLTANVFTLSAENGVPKKTVSLQAVLDLFIPILLEQMLYAEDHAVKKFIAPAVAKHSDLEAVRAKVEESLPEALDKKDCDRIVKLVRGAETVESVLGRFLRSSGRRAFEHEFPST